VFDLDPGEDMKVVESNNPSMELQQFSRLIVMVALKALDIPYSFFDESHTNYSGSRGSWMHYERSTMTARDDQVNMRTAWTKFQYQRWILEGRLKLPRGMTIDDLAFEWVPLGMPWWDPLKEINGDLLAVGSGLDSAQRITKERGKGDIFDNIDDNIAVIKYARDRGMEELGEPYRLSFDALTPEKMDAADPPEPASSEADKKGDKPS
jgi:capsid protein